ncbi:2-hydroxychromene-2-carboxylate isomerase/DsbA-like thioredoxin domain [hydrothermal vent metagenome]|uniref:2-hydroxychromene-2-carboxylate isomerase/DsbA-like thioredoxin domain n=1 Tax=hydrothermal vent metagenome TaxID=652676 RepID=A0A3B0U3H8_9ZZZZ
MFGIADIKIDIFSDPVCPWCLVGIKRLDNAMARLDTGAVISIVYHPFLLDANTPKEGEDVVEMLTRKYGRLPDDMWRRLQDEARSSGLVLDMGKQKTRYPSQRALALIEAAGEKGSQHQLASAISHACYIDGLNISDIDVLETLALAHGFERKEAAELLHSSEAITKVEQKAKWAAEMGVSGVPFFVFNNSFALSGAQPETVFDDALQKASLREPISD